MTEIDATCQHKKLRCRVTYSSDRQTDKAIVSCKRCGFSVEIIGTNLTDEGIKTEFNTAAHRAAIGRRMFLLN